MTIKHSPARTAHVVGAVASNHTLPRQQLESIVGDALQAALVYDADVTYAGRRADSVRTDADTAPPARPAEDARQAAAEAMRQQYLTKRGNGGSR